VSADTSARLQASAHRFRRHRREQLLLGIADCDAGTVRVQRLWYCIGIVLAVLMLAAHALFALVRAPELAGDAPLLLGRESGSLYVRINNTMHPVLNLSSARLALGSPRQPRLIADTALPAGPSGALLGIPGAPGIIGQPLAGDDAGWSVCDGPETTVIAGRPGPDAVSLGADDRVLLTDSTGSTYLVYDGHRAMVDAGDPVLARSLDLQGRRAVAASDALIALIPEVPALTVPLLPDAGAPGPEALPGLAIGDVVQVSRAGGIDMFVVLAGGVQRIGAVAADLLRSMTGQSGDIPVLTQSIVAQVPELGSLPVAWYPQRRGSYRQDLRYLCASWSSGRISLSTADRRPLPSGTAAATLTQADATGPRVDAVAIATGRSAYVHPDTGVRDTGTVITSTGVRFRIADAGAAGALGLPTDSEPAPWQLIEQLPAGPELSRAAALIAHDVLGPGPS